jgi:hypothetical protein
MPPIGADVGSMQIRMLGVQTWEFCAHQARAGGRSCCGWHGR